MACAPTYQIRCTLSNANRPGRTTLTGSSIEIAHQADDERSHLRVLRNDVRLDTIHLENRPTCRPDGADDHALVQGPHQILGEAEALRNLEQVPKLDLAGH